MIRLATNAALLDIPVDPITLARATPYELRIVALTVDRVYRARREAQMRAEASARG